MKIPYLVPRRPGFAPGSVRVGFVVDKVALKPIPVAARSAGIAGSNPAEGVDVFSLVFICCVVLCR
jgi:hypothetical protein